MHRRSETRELVLQQLGFEAERKPCALHHRAAWSSVAAHEQGYAEDALVTDDGDFGRRPILHGVEQRNDRRGREVDVPQRGPGFIHTETSPSFIGISSKWDATRS